MELPRPEKGFAPIIILILLVVICGISAYFIFQKSSPLHSLIPSEQSSNNTDTLFGTFSAYLAQGGFLIAKMGNESQTDWSVFKSDSQEFEKYLSSLQQYYESQDVLVKETGFSSDREMAGLFTWNVIETEKGNFDWRLTDLAAQHAKETGIKFSAVIQPYAAWDQKNTAVIAGCSDTYYNSKAGPPNDWVEYQNFLTAMVKRYKDVVSDWEIGNEPEGNCSGYQNNPQAYFDLLKISSETIKKADPQAIVLNGGASGFADYNSNERDYWTKFFELGGGKYLDVFNLHWDREKNGAASDPSAFLKVLDFYNNLITSQSLKMPLWITEFGTYSGTPAPPASPNRGEPAGGPTRQNQPAMTFPTQSPEFQAAWYFRYSILAFANNTERIFPDFVGQDNQNIGGGAIFNTQGQSRLFLKTLQTIDSKIQGFSKVEKIADGQYKFAVGSKTIYALWSGTLAKEISGQVKVTDIRGQEQTVDATAVKLSADQPVFLELQK
ncbi:MAG: hypothetical protein ABSA43_01000 [Candidatus Microgenomates bacterium]|jgi:hypothetical protein